MFGKSLAAAFLAVTLTIGAAHATDVDALKERAEKGDAQAQYELGMLYKNGQEGLKADTQAAIDWLAQSAKNGLEKADKAINDIYANRDDIAKSLQENADKAGDLFDKGVAAGKDWWNEMTGSGVAKDAEKAFEWLKKSAQSGNAAAQNKLGEMYLEGIGVAKDNAAAAEWFKKACANGSKEACLNYGKATLRSF